MLLSLLLLLQLQLLRLLQCTLLFLRRSEAQEPSGGRVIVWVTRTLVPLDVVP